MALLPYTLNHPAVAETPLLVDSPHSGRIYPVDFAYACPLPLLRQTEDAYVDELVSGATEAGATILQAEFPRSMIDLNRAENDIDPAAIDGVWGEPLCPDAMTRAGFGLVRRLCRAGVPLYRAPLTEAEIRRRLTVYYRPYHACLQKLVATRLDRFGRCFFIDAHSMPGGIEKNGARVDFVLGSLDDTSCDPDFTRRAQRILQDQGYSVALNAPYKGREILQRYGLTGQGAQTFQLEISRALYLNEKTLEKHQGFDKLREDLSKFFDALLPL